MSRPDAHVEVVFRADRDVESWAARHARGEVPGRWPYGLDLLAGRSTSLTVRGLPEPSRAAVAAGRLRRALDPSSTARPAEVGVRDIGVAWDENLARRMLYQAPRREMYSGAIWLTDALARGDDPRRLRSVLGVLRSMRGVFVNSAAQVQPLRDAFGPGGPDVSYFTFGVDDVFFRPRPYPERPLVMSVGVDRDRDPGTLFAALETVHRNRPDVEILVQTRSDVEPPPGVTRVPTMSHVELRDLYERAGAVVIATRPNLHISGLTASLESMAMARPVVLTRTPGAEDYIDDGRTGLFASVGDPGSVAGRILDLLAAPDEARGMGESARAVVEARLTSAHMVRGLSRALGLSD
ncbi:glycosyltransferase family 4 protein [Cellulomonas sp. KRMCY2]|uniref:glycosyltransferase family 4 protein n=1 Tax=Cellulomonas sp. KRMCY2 TaxID=1304865 RepID=UPI0004A28524|nr:glycosyltransferase family 4 protein [Cellulomonas sp. KRMCY2]